MGTSVSPCLQHHDRDHRHHDVGVDGHLVPLHRLEDGRHALPRRGSRSLIPRRTAQVTDRVGEYRAGPSDKISHVDMGDGRIDAVISHIISPYPISISRMTTSIP
jgi:hypothetical protein